MLSGTNHFPDIDDDERPAEPARSSAASSMWTIPAIISHDPQSPAVEESNLPPVISQPTLPPRNSNQFLSRLSNFIRRGPPSSKPTITLLPKAQISSSQYSYENPGYGTRADAMPISPLSMPTTSSQQQYQPQASSITLPAPRRTTNGSTDYLGQSDDEIDDLKNNAINATDTTKSGAKGGKDTGESSGGAHAGDENKVRGNWGSHFEFVLSCVGYAVGLGNVWRFPYLCYKNGGGTFLVIYWILSITVGFPIIFLELSIGQFTSQGPTGVWNYAPIVKGLGYSMCAISGIGAIYYNIIISWALYYLFASFRSQLLWSECDFTSWADYRCELQKIDCLDPYQLRANDGLCYSLKPFFDAGQATPYFVPTLCPYSTASAPPNSMVPCVYMVGQVERNRSTVVGCWNEKLAFDNHRGPEFSTEQFFFRNVLGQDGKRLSGYSAVSLGLPQKWLVLCLLLAWILVFICLLNGIKSSGKVVYFTALFPYVVLAVLIGKGISLPGSIDGIMYFLKPNIEKMKDPNVWYAAASQLFFSLSACWGGMMALSSYNKFHTNALRDALIVTSADTLTSFIASFAIFSVIGYGSHILNKPVDEVADAGTGLAFILYPKIIDSLPGSVAWAILFFFMLLLLGLDSEFNSLETIFTALLDKYPSLRSSLKRKAAAFALFCIPFFLLGLPLVCPGGTQLLELIDEYGAGWGVFFIGIVETLSVAWLYGAPRFAKDISAMMPFLLNGKIRAKVVPWILRISWGIITPTILFFIMVYSWTKYEPRQIMGEEVLGWCVTVFVMIWIPATAIWVVFQQWRRQGSFMAAFKTSITPSAKWGPFLEEHRREVAAIHGDMLTAVADSADGSLDCVLDDDKINNNDDDGNNQHYGSSSSGGRLRQNDCYNNAMAMLPIRGSLSLISSSSSSSNNRYPNEMLPPVNIAMALASPNASSLSSAQSKSSAAVFDNLAYNDGSKSSISSRSTAV